MQLIPGVAALALAALLVLPGGRCSAQLVSASAQRRLAPAAKRAGTRRSGQPPGCAHREAQPEHGHGHLRQPERHLSLSRLRHVGRARRRQRPARAADHRQGRLPERDGRAAPAGRRPVHHAIQHHELSQEDRRVRPQHRQPGWPTSPSSTTRRCTSSPARASSSIQDLNGKKVNFSDVGSGTQFSTRLIFELLGIKAAGGQRRPGRRLSEGQVRRDRRHRADRRQADRLVRQVQARARHDAAAGRPIRRRWSRTTFRPS